MKLIRLITTFLLGTTISLGQVISSSIIGNKERGYVDIPSSPSVGNFRIFGEFSPSNFIGVTDVNIPVHTIDCRGYKLPLVLRYHNGMGNKVEMQPGSTGLGWHLNSGGVISLIKSRIDRYDYNGLELITDEDGVLGGDDWSTTNKLKLILGSTSGGLAYNVSAEEGSLRNYAFSVNFNGYSGELYFDHNNQPKFRSKDNQYLHVKDIVFQKTLVNGKISGIKSFVLLDEDGVEYTFGENLKAIEYTYQGHNPTLKRISYGEGEKAFLKAIKRTQTAWHLSKIVFPNKEEILFNYIREAPFYTTKVFTDLKTLLSYNPYGSVDELFYGAYDWINSEQATIVNPSNLESIETPFEKVVFEYSNSAYGAKNIGLYENFNVSDYIGMSWWETINNYTVKQLAKKNISTFQTAQRLTAAEAGRSLRKLDNIYVYNTIGEIEKSIHFEYTISFWERTKLLNMVIRDAENNTNEEKYTFEYDMPNYKSPDAVAYNKDDYGYYNDNKNYFGYIEDYFSRPDGNGIGLYLNNFKTNAAQRNNYIEKRKPKITQFNTWEILNKIIYPTGGYTTFEYEANMYGSVAKNYPFVVESNSNNIAKPTGGVRVKSIKNFDVNDALLSSKSYKYVRNYEAGGNQSSGILTHIPTYFDVIKANITSDNWNIDYFRWSTEDIYPANRLRGNHVTYSEVAEIDDADNSFIIYKYKNFDNGYHDKPILNYASHYDTYLKDENGNNKNIWEKWDVISMDLERGQLVNKAHYDSNKKKVKELKYEYNDNPARFEDYIRVVNLYDNQMYNPENQTLHAFTYIASLIYTYTPYLKKKTETDFKGTNSIVKQETSYKYHDKYKSVIEKEEKIGDKTYKTTYKYPFDYGTASVYNSMVNKNMISPVVLEENYINGAKVSALKTNYNIMYPILQNGEEIQSMNFEEGHTVFNIQVPTSIEVQHKNGEWEKQTDFLAYDKYYNLLSYRDKSQMITNYIWGYQKSLPMWKISNVSYQTLMTGGLTRTKVNEIGNPSIPPQQKRDEVNQILKNNPALEDAFIEHYLYDPLKGMIYKEDISGKREYYEYDGFGRLKRVKDDQQNTLIEYEYNYKQ